MSKKQPNSFSIIWKRKEDAELQTKLHKISMRGAPQVADAILESVNYSFAPYDRPYVARLCESSTLFQRALWTFRCEFFLPFFPFFLTVPSF